MWFCVYAPARNVDELQGSAYFSSKRLVLPVQELDHTGTNRAQPDKPEFDPLPRHYTARSFLSAGSAGALAPPKALRIPRTACRVRCSFSIKAKRT